MSLSCLMIRSVIYVQGILEEVQSITEVVGT